MEPTPNPDPLLPDQAASPRWSISRTEFDGIAARSHKSLLQLRIAFAGLGLLSVGTIVAGVLVERLGVEFVIIGAVGLATCVAYPLWLLRTVRRSAAMLPTVWETNGCVCPLCLERVDAAPCARHGVSAADQPVLLEIWQSSARQDAAASMRAMHELRGRTRRPLHHSIVHPLQRALTACLDPELSFRERLRATLPLLVIGALAAAIVLAVIRTSLGPGSLRPMIGCWYLPLLAMLMLWAGPAFRAGRLRCAACGQLCADDHPTRCAECGADLTRATSTTRMVSNRRKMIAIQAVSCLPILLMTAGYWIPGGLFGWLPLSVRAPAYRLVGAPMNLWRDLNASSMTQGEVDVAVQLLAEAAAPDGPRPVFDFDFITAARAAGKLTDSMTEATARAIVQATLEVDAADGAPIAVVRPAFGEMILGRGLTPRLVFGGVSIDGRPWSPGASWSLFLHDVHPYFRTHGSLPALPEEQLAFRAPLAGLAPGTHALRARCWIVLHEDPWVRYEPRFDEHGTLVPPANATVYDLELETSHEAP